MGIAVSVWSPYFIVIAGPCMKSLPSFNLDCCVKALWLEKQENIRIIYTISFRYL